jgi:hypothetical protein
MLRCRGDLDLDFERGDRERENLPWRSRGWASLMRPDELECNLMYRVSVDFDMFIVFFTSL